MPHSCQLVRQSHQSNSPPLSSDRSPTDCSPAQLPSSPARADHLSSQPFPTKIWQSWKDDSENPTPRTISFPHQWRTINPSYRYERLTDANMDAYIRERAPPAISDLFTSLTDPILKADFLHYLILLYDGGVWADIDTFPHRPISEWIPPQYRDRASLVIGIENDHHRQPIWPRLTFSVQLCQYTVLAKPGHPAVRTLVEEVARNLGKLMASRVAGDATTFAEVMFTTGPFVFTRALMGHLLNKTGIVHTGDEMDNLQEPRLIGDVLVLPKDSFGWLPQGHTHPKEDEMVLVEHLFIASWRAGHPG
ncbi:hypothetical protein B0T14DRAFT_494108 [Immersiella caudata]|uniref:Initiation-specific alpha-1,6-mannosyltransferase n=1 Tax=Immersiella caudata TaxID=314043 RepID=A0AA39WVM3_9PEZI|nr:hypothetical protein B0T14DRAFT_494108 [Immersiella caudata]